MFEESCSYQQDYKGKKQSSDTGEELVIFKYRFDNSNRRILVQVEFFPKYKILILKFFDKAHALSELKFNLLTGAGGLTKILRTCVNIMLEHYNNDSEISIGFVGAPTEKEKESGKEANSKRFRIYSGVMTRFFAPVNFQHQSAQDCNLYLMLNRQYFEKHKLSPYSLLQFLKKEYPNDLPWDVII